MKLLVCVMERVRAEGFCVENADVTIVAQRPKLAAYIPQMRQNLVRALGTENVNVQGDHDGAHGI